jgi:hypothetical protein
MVNKKNTEDLLYKIIMFILIFGLVISIVFTVDRLVIDKPIDNCYKNYDKGSFNEECNYNELEINNCYNQEGNVLYNKDCSIECDFCQKEYFTVLDKYNEKLNLSRMIFSFVLALSLVFIRFKDKIIKYALLSGSLASLFISTLMASNLIGKILPVVIIIEFVLVLFIYKKTK